MYLLFLAVANINGGTILATLLLAVDTTGDTIIAVPLPWVTFAVASGIPLAVALLTNSSASSAVKSITAMILMAITAVGTTLIDNGGSAPATELASAFVAVVLAHLASHQLVGKGLGAERAIQTATKGKGIG